MLVVQRSTSVPPPLPNPTPPCVIYLTHWSQKKGYQKRSRTVLPSIDRGDVSRNWGLWLSPCCQVLSLAEPWRAARAASRLSVRGADLASPSSPRDSLVLHPFTRSRESSPRPLLCWPSISSPAPCCPPVLSLVVLYPIGLDCLHLQEATRQLCAFYGLDNLKQCVLCRHKCERRCTSWWKILRHIHSTCGRRHPVLSTAWAAVRGDAATRKWVCLTE